MNRLLVEYTIRGKFFVNVDEELIEEAETLLEDLENGRGVEWLQSLVREGINLSEISVDNYSFSDDIIHPEEELDFEPE